jgi:hypothetical protein
MVYHSQLKAFKPVTNKNYFMSAMDRYLWRVFRCAFCLPSTPLKFEDIGLWVWNFPSKVRTIVAARVVALIGII